MISLSDGFATSKWSNLLTPVLWLQFYHKMNDEKMDIDTSIGGDGSGESFISISYLKKDVKAMQASK